MSAGCVSKIKPKGSAPLNVALPSLHKETVWVHTMATLQVKDESVNVQTSKSDHLISHVSFLTGLLLSNKSKVFTQILLIK